MGQGKIRIPDFNMTGTPSSTTYLRGDGLWSAITGYVPYTGASSNVDLGEYQITTGQVVFDQTPTQTAGVGILRWNDSDGTLDLGLKGGNVTLQIGQETVLRIVNKTATNITLSEANYQVVRITGAQGQRPKVDLALADSDLNSATAIGLVTETILINQEGYINTSGTVREINTTGSLQGETWVDGDTLYLSGTVAGQITNIKPVAPVHIITIGYVLYAHAIHGTIFVKVDNGYELEELHNVLINTPLNNDALVYETSSGLWKNKTISTALGFTPENQSNKSDSYTVSSSITYTSSKALVDGLATKDNVIGTFNIINNSSYNAFPGCVKMSNGNLICVYRKGTSHSSDKGDIMKIISADDGRTWSSETIAFSHATLDVRDPSVTLLSNGNILLTYFTYNISTLRYVTYTKISTDNGATWGIEVSVGGFTYDSGVSSPAIQLGSGDLLLSIYGTDIGDTFTSNKIVKSTNSGASWSTLSTLANGQALSNNYSEPSLVLLSNGNVLALNRNETDNNSYSRISTDSGVTWGSLSIAKSAISRASLLRTDNENVLMSYRSYDDIFATRWKPAICTISADGTIFGDENIFDLQTNTLDVYSSLVKISQGRYAMAYCLEYSGTKADLFFRYINETELVKDISLVQGVSSYGNSYFKKSIFVNEEANIVGYVNALGFKTETGTSSQFLKANGSVDGTAYAPSSGSSEYIHNQFSSAQSGNFWINGFSRFGNTSEIDRGGASGDFLRFIHPTKNWSIYMDSGGFYIKNLTDMTYPFNILPSGGSIFTGTITASPAIVSTELVTKGQLDAVARPYKVYTALVSQPDTNTPTATVLENTLGGTPTWSRQSAGVFHATLTGAFTLNKTVVFALKDTTSPTGTAGVFIRASRLSDDVVILTVVNFASGGIDSQLANSSIEIRVYN